MSTTFEAPGTDMRSLLEQLAALKIRLHAEDGQLRVQAPAGVLSDALREALKQHRDKLLAHLSGDGQPAAAWPRVQADEAARHQPFPLTDVQHAYWLGRSRGLDLGGVSTHYYFELDCAGLDLQRFGQAFQCLVNRHDMLRAVVLADGQQQVLPAPQAFTLASEDLRLASEAERAQRAQALRDQMSHQMLPTHQWPLFDIRALRLGDTLTRVYFSWDFINLDAWSLYTIFREWATLYADPNAALPAIGLSYRDYVLGVRALHGSEMVQRDRRYWSERIDSIPPAPQLPVRSPAAAAAAPRFTRRRLRMPTPRWNALKRRAQAEGLTPSGLLLAAYAEVLAYWSKEPRFSINMTVFSRLPLHEDVNKLLGDFTCLTLLEVDAGHAHDFRARAQAIQSQFLRDFDHRLVSGVDVLRDWSKRHGYGLQAAMPVVFTSCLALTAAQGDDAGQVESFGPQVYGISQTPQVWLDNQVMEDRQGLALNWDALEAVFAPGVLDDMFAAYGDLLDRLATDDAAWQARHPLRLPQPQALQREQVNRTEAPAGTPFLHQPFVRQALSRPDATAVISHNREVGYGELLARCTALAGTLRSQGLAVGEVVAVVMPKGWQQIAAVLGILIGGGAYLPIDVDLPPARRRQLLEQGGARLAVTGTDAPALPDGVARVVFDGDAPAPARLVAAPEVRQQPGSLAYVIFTSGSTGVPKGVMIEHQAAANTVEHVNRLFGVTAADRVLMVSSLSFDLSTYDIFGLLGAGGCVVVPDHERSVDPEHWLALMRRHQVSIWNSAPPLMSMLMSSMEGFDEPPVRGLRLALLSGDWIALTLPQRMARALPQARVVSLGGATEASIWSIYFPVQEVEPQWTSIPYGRPLPNQTMHVLNDGGVECPCHVTGRIHIGGAGLARGYLNDAQATARQFITGADGRRLYATGDLGRYLPSGDIEFLGREDTQVKLRGHRIELGEISAALRALPAVKESLAVVDGDARSGHQSLWVYLQLGDPHATELLRPLGQGQDFSAHAPAALAAAVAAGQASTPPQRLTPPVESLWQQLDALYDAAVLGLLSGTRLFTQAGPVSLDDLMAQLQAAPRYRRWMVRAVRRLAALGLVHEPGGEAAGFAALAPAPRPDLPGLAAEVEQQLQDVLQLTAHEARWFTTGAQRLPEILSEQLHSAELYTAEETARIYQKLFPDSHHQLQRAVAALVHLRPGQALRVVEVGAGLGSATQHLLPALQGHCERYDFTDLSPYFLKHAQARFGAYPFIHYDLLDLDRPAEYQGYKPHGYDLVVASSVLHDVADVGRTLRHLRRLLSPGGVLMLLEETRFFRAFDLTMGLQQGFDVFSDDRQDQPLLSRQAWQQKAVQAGFAACTALSVPGTVADFVGFDVIVAQTVEPAFTLDDEALNRFLMERLPVSMKPTGYQLVEAFPTTPNGKIDYKALARSVRGKQDEQVVRKPATNLEQQVLDIWRDVLRQDAISTTSSFFDIGGDSLLLVEVRNRIKQKFGLQVATTTLFEYPTIASLAGFLARQQPADADLEGIRQRAEQQRQAMGRRRHASREVQPNV